MDDKCLITDAKGGFAVVTAKIYVARELFWDEDFDLVEYIAKRVKRAIKKEAEKIKKEENERR